MWFNLSPWSSKRPRPPGRFMNGKPKRQQQLAYSERQALMLDETSRRVKAGKIASVLEHFLGRSSLSGLRLLDIGCSGGIVASELHKRGASVIGADIDVPGLTRARASYGDTVSFLCSDGARLPVAGGSIDVVVLNHIYEHVVDPWAVAAEIARVLAPDGVAYLGLANRLGVMEPHYRLPFLSWLPRPLAHRYVRAFGRADSYYERFLIRPNLRRLFSAFDIWDYSLPVLTEPERFGAGDVVPGPVSRLPAAVLRPLTPLIPTYIWIGTHGGLAPLGPALAIPPTHLPSRGGASA
jgi:2-polyprenyl-3-methyl-5-hydroxy-6-metoxy-1,4-benzoquinol methylase